MLSQKEERRNPHQRHFGRKGGGIYTSRYHPHNHEQRKEARKAHKRARAAKHTEMRTLPNGKHYYVLCKGQ